MGRLGSGRAAGDPGRLQVLGRHSGLAPGAVGDALALRVRLGVLDEVLAQVREVDRDVEALELGRQVDPALGQLELAQARGRTDLRLDLGELRCTVSLVRLRPRLGLFACSASR